MGFHGFAVFLFKVHVVFMFYGLQGDTVPSPVKTPHSNENPERSGADYKKAPTGNGRGRPETRSSEMPNGTLNPKPRLKKGSRT